MSGPIVRKYGFPNFDKIFGAREVQHGADQSATDAPAEAAQKPETDKASEKRASKKRKGGKSKE